MTAKCISLDFYHTLMDGCDFPVCLGSFSSSFISCGLPWSTAMRLLLFKFLPPGQLIKKSCVILSHC